MSQNTGDRWLYPYRDIIEPHLKTWLTIHYYLDEDIRWRIGPPTLRFVNRVKELADMCPHDYVKRGILELLKGIS